LAHIRPRHFYEVFADLARAASHAAGILHRIFSAPHPFTELLAEMTEVERGSAEARQELVADIELATVTPIDRKDVHQLASRLGGLVSLLHDTARSVQDVHLTHTREAALALSEVVMRATACIEQSVAQLKNPEVVVDQRIAMERMSEEGIAIYDRASSALFAGRPEAMDVLRWKDVYDALEHALTECRAVQNALSSIALDNR
jgi:uncharacterized protein Yka (UPF0111/DUF47 family)